MEKILSDIFLNRIGHRIGHRIGDRIGHRILFPKKYTIGSVDPKSVAVMRTRFLMCTAVSYEA